MNTVVASLLTALLLTLAVELGLAALLGVRGLDLVIIAAANCLTNPLVNYLFDWAWVLCGGQPLIPYVCLAALEAAAVFGEALLYRRLLSYRRIGALRLSLLLNAASFAAGLVIALVESFLT